MRSLPQCAVRTCTHEADPRWFARDVNGRAVMICDGHDPTPPASEVTPAAPDPGVYDLAERIVRHGYSASAAEVERIAYALIVEAADAKARDTELGELRDLAFAIHADIGLSPEQLEVKQRLIADRYAKQVAKAEAAIAEAWEPAARDGVQIVRCRRCRFEAFPFADATIEDHMQTCAPETR